MSFPIESFLAGFQVILSVIFIPFLVSERGYDDKYVQAIKIKAASLCGSDACLKNTICSSVEFYSVFRRITFCLSALFLVCASKNILNESIQQVIIFPLFICHISIAILFIIFWYKVYVPIRKYYSEIIAAQLSEKCNG